MQSEAANEIISRLKKLKSLADKGVDGEAEAAKRLLEKVAKKHNIDINSISSDVKRFSVKSTGWRLSLIFQLCAIVCGVNNFTTLRGSYKSETIIECEEDKWLEVAARFKILEKDYKEQLALFYEAFLVCNNLTLSPDNSSKLNDDELKQDIERLKKVSKMAKGLTRSAKLSHQENEIKKISMS